MKRKPGAFVSVKWPGLHFSIRCLFELYQSLTGLSLLLILLLPTQLLLLVRKQNLHMGARCQMRMSPDKTVQRRLTGTLV